MEDHKESLRLLKNLAKQSAEENDGLGYSLLRCCGFDTKIECKYQILANGLIRTSFYNNGVKMTQKKIIQLAEESDAFMIAATKGESRE